jgi:tartrate-resistant acid phosphatase type 5
MIRNYFVLLSASFLIAACDSPQTVDEPAPVEPTAAANDGVGILVFGDSGYHLNYPDQDDYEDLFTADEFAQFELVEWLEDKRPRDEFEARPSDISPVTEKVVAASGLHRVSVAMRDYCANSATCDFGVMLGDNIYPSGATLGTDGFDDELRFKEVLGDPFANIVDEPAAYTSYVTLGNHDWETSREGGLLQVKYLEDTDGFYMDGTFYSVKPAAGKGEIELFVVDTSMILATLPVLEDDLNDDGSEASSGEVEPHDYFVSPMTEDELRMHEWLEDSLKNSTAKWKFVVAHHPIWSSAGSKFEQGRALRKVILPAMCRYADAYIVGHEHTLEIHTDDCSAALGEATAKPLVQIVSGAASKQRPLNTNFMKHQEAKYPEHETVLAEGLLWGFMHMQVQGDSAKVTVLSIPDEGSSDTTVDFEYEFERRSHIDVQ